MLLNQFALNTIVVDGGPFDSVPPHSGAPGGRFISDADVTFLLTSEAIAYYFRVKIPDANGVIYDYSNRDAINWCHSLEYSGDIDAPIATATVKLWRTIGGRSLAPFKTGSSYNTPGPSIDAGRRIIIDTASVAMSKRFTDLVESDWRTIFDGFIDTVDEAQTPIVLECRDLACVYQDTWFPSTDIVPDTGANIQTALQTLITLLAPDSTDPLWVPVPPDPAVIVGAFRYDIEAGLDALVRVAQIIGWDLRPRWSDADGRFRLCFKDPGRNKTTPDFTITASSYFDVQQLKIDRTPIRNDVTIWYGAAGSRASVNASNAASIARYGRRSMVIQEASDSPIQTSADASTMAALIVNDIDAPVADQQLEMPYFWPIELHDLVQFTANLVHADEDLDLAVVGYKHVLENQGKSRTTLTVRGKPAGGYFSWLSRGTTVTEPNTAASQGGFSGLNQTADFVTNTVTMTWNFRPPGATYEVFVEEDVGVGFVSQGTTSSATWTYHTVADIEAEGSGDVTVAFYVTATIAGVLVATSRPSWGFYKSP